MTDPASPKRDRDLRAAELALGLLSGGERAEAERELLRDPLFRASHAFWSAKAEQWLEEVPPVEDAPDLWSSIEASIGREQSALAGSPYEPVPRRGPAFGWAIAATVAAVLAGTSAVYFFKRETSARQDNAQLAQRLAKAEGERRVAQITGDASKVLVSALYDPSNGTIDLKLDIPSEPSLLPELWIIPGDGKPRSLGTFTTASATLRIDPSVRSFLTDGATLAVTMEPAEGAPHDAPTGPILGTTVLRSI